MFYFQSRVPVNARRYVYCVGLREGNAQDYQFLFQQYQTSENAADMVVILRALGCTRDTESLNQYVIFINLIFGFTITFQSSVAIRSVFLS